VSRRGRETPRARARTRTRAATRRREARSRRAPHLRELAHLGARLRELRAQRVQLVGERGARLGRVRVAAAAAQRACVRLAQPFLRVCELGRRLLGRRARVVGRGARGVDVGLELVCARVEGVQLVRLRAHDRVALRELRAGGAGRGGAGGGARARSA
jgi:hypothetical protein